MSALIAGEREKPTNGTLEQLIRARKWEEASKELSRVEKAGLCEGSVCLAARALILNGQGKVKEAQDYARQAAERIGEAPGLSAWQYNELGVLLYRLAGEKTESLRLAESAFRRAVAAYKGRASNIRFNLTTVLGSLGRREEAKQIMDELESEGGILVDRNMSILGDLQLPAKQ